MLPGHSNTIQGMSLQPGSWPGVWPQVQIGRGQDWGKRTKMPKVTRLKYSLNFEASAGPSQGLGSRGRHIQIECSLLTFVFGIVRVGTSLKTPE